MFYKYHKETNAFSNQTIRQLGKELKVNKVGHTGILDPLASGLMIIATDYDTKLLEYIANKNKVYIATSKLHWNSETLDITGNLTYQENKKVSIEQLKKAIELVCSRTTQIPPKYSAKKINGQRAYDLARENKEFSIKEQKIKVLEYELLNFDYEKQEYIIKFNVSEGTYIRTLLYDISLELNTVSAMSSLKRTGVGNVLLDDLKEKEYQAISLNDLFDIEMYFINKEQAKIIMNGQSIKIKTKNELVFLLNPITKEVCCVGIVKDNIFYPKKVFNERLVWNNLKI
ncbi:tRNA pseudouridine(55) synthase TruB [Mycoplasmopsis felis]|uniref:tRNA pseudouridine(55) synthase TruB n=1 Tax=Mycoplasmopsis felis TaxID=33923 RepID=UPI002AFEA96B|nr:tRNA pseudouridine(55) synthase TruB [Mycoplasmopsis felis]WQQ03353.1 tRNA pseudouridine(55) synthase TruB [Mycoplasmopsis felis]